MSQERNLSWIDMYYQFIFLQSHLSFNVRKDIFKRKYHLVLVVQESESRQMLKLCLCLQENKQNLKLIL